MVTIMLKRGTKVINKYGNGIEIETCDKSLFVSETILMMLANMESDELFELANNATENIHIPILDDGMRQ